MNEEPMSFLNQLYDLLYMTAITVDTMYLHQTVVHPDREEYLKAMVNNQKRIHLHVVSLEKIPKRTMVLDAE